MKKCRVILSVGETLSIVYTSITKTNVKILEHVEYNVMEYINNGVIKDEFQVANIVSEELKLHKKEYQVEGVSVLLPSSLYTEDYVTVENDKKTSLATYFHKTYFKNNGTNNKVNVICFDKTDTVEDTARFVGIRIYNPISVEVGSNQVTTVTPDQNNIYPRIMEFTVYGKYKDASFDPTKSDYVDTKNVDLSKLEESYGKNLLSPEMLTAYYNGRVVVRNDGTTQAKIYTKIDEVFELDPKERNTSHIDINGSGGGIVDLVFRVPDYEMTDFEGFCIQNMFKLSNSHTCSEYMVYVGEEKEDLFQTPVFHYNLDDYDHTQGQLVSFDPENLPRGQYFAIRIVNPVNTALNETYWRSSVIYAWGAEADIKAVPANLAENMPCNIDLIKGKKRTEVSEKNLSANELMQITDSNVTVDENDIKTYTSKLNTSGVISTNGNTLELVYNLCGNMEVDKLLVSTLINSTTGFTTMKVYCSDVLDGVHSSDALIWTYKVGDLQGTISPSKSLVRFSNSLILTFLSKTITALVTFRLLLILRNSSL